MCQVANKIYKLSLFVYLCIFICCTKDNNYKVYDITNDSVKRQILNVLHKKSTFELCKIPPKIIITIKSKEKKHDEKFIICGHHVKGNKGTTYKYEINIEEELYKIEKAWK